ncbi:hypothetical protein RchiOBHm_Chr4g0420751 [Rosa chinensis]|uniref:Uncharacterized protein n=1 Tax=Rosa chinensis TaxID=74649 RepID=A0A2P6QXW3_ROSCH|nr:hypothetical protein RchiOBHm_Chr5g0032621 [Rosa chinensis]PRQ39047.1 hypothetical protein RchiOBHm_Chr4g0420751 [Rosa chinensis]
MAALSASSSSYHLCPYTDFIKIQQCVTEASVFGPSIDSSRCHIEAMNQKESPTVFPPSQNRSKGYLVNFRFWPIVD